MNELADEPLRKALKTLPEGEVSPVLELQNCCSIIRVLGRRKESIVPFENVSAQLSHEIKEERISKAQRNLPPDDSMKANIHTILDADWNEYWDKRLGQSGANKAKARRLAAADPAKENSVATTTQLQPVAFNTPEITDKQRKRFTALLGRNVGPDRYLKPDDVVAVFYGQPLRASDLTLPYEELVPIRVFELQHPNLRPGVPPFYPRYRYPLGFNPPRMKQFRPSIFSLEFNPASEIFARKLFSMTCWREMTPAEQTKFEADIPLRLEADISRELKQAERKFGQNLRLPASSADIKLTVVQQQFREQFQGRLRERFRERELEEVYLIRIYGQPRLPSEAELRQLYEEKHVGKRLPTGVRWQQVNIAASPRTARDEARRERIPFAVKSVMDRLFWRRPGRARTTPLCFISRTRIGRPHPSWTHSSCL